MHLADPARPPIGRLATLVSGLAHWLRTLNPMEAIALVATALTPLTLYLDYRRNLAPISDFVKFEQQPGQQAANQYYQLVGLTQLVWLGAGSVTLVLTSRRDGFRSLTTVCLVFLLVVVVGATALQGGVDRFATVALTATLLPLIAMAGVLTNPNLRRAFVSALVLLFACATAAVVLATLAKNVRAGTLDQRFDLLMFPSPLDTGAILVLLVLLLVGIDAPLGLRISLIVLLGGAALLTQTRGALFAGVAGAVVFALLVRRRRLSVAVLAVAAVAVVGFAVVGDRPLDPFANDLSTVYRRENIEQHLRFLDERPAFGWGMNRAEASRFVAAHNTLLSLANAAGVAAVVFWLAAWVWPVLQALRRDPTSWLAATAASVLVAAFVLWNTTGPEVLLYSPPTNLLPLLFAVSLAASVPPRPR